MMKHRWLLIMVVGLLMTILLTGCTADMGGNASSGSSAATTVKKPVEPEKPAKVDTIPVKIYFGTHDAKYIIAEVHQLQNDSQLMKRAMEALAAGPGNSSLMAVIPKATKVRSVVLKEKTAFVDFSAEIAKRGFGGSATEILAVGAIVNTLTEFPGVEQVQILVEGKKVDTLYGHLDVYDPMSRSPAIIKGK
ncbi:MAG: GerMN domain-containing protein [Negativicutes bacterium]